MIETFQEKRHRSLSALEMLAGSQFAPAVPYCREVARALRALAAGELTRFDHDTRDPLGGLVFHRGIRSPERVVGSDGRREARHTHEFFPPSRRPS